LKPKQVLVPVGTDDELLQKLLEVDVHTPLRGKKKDLTELASKNANLELNEKFSLIEMNEQRTIQSDETLGDIVHIEEPRHIAAFDTANIHGTDPDAEM